MQFALKSLLVSLLFSPGVLWAQVELRGEVKDESGEKLSFANVLLLPDSVIVPADYEGEFKINLTAGEKQVVISYTGFETIRSSLNLKTDTSVAFVLRQDIGQLEELTINANRYSQELLVQ